MPRISPTERERQMEAVCRRVRHHYDDMRRKPNSDCKKVALALGFPCYQTLVNRFKHPSGFTLGELITIANTMNISLATLISGKEELYD